MGDFRKDLFKVGLFTTHLFFAPYILGNDYYLSTLTLACIHAIIAVGLNLLMGYAGQISLGHAAFYGLAAYVTAILTTRFSVPIPVSMAASVISVGAVALAIGIPTLKLRGHYLAMATLGFGIIVYIIFNETVDLTGGPSGFVGIPRLELFGYRFDSDTSCFYIIAASLSLVVFMSLNLIHSRFGRALRALHTSETAAQVSGIDIGRYKIFVFVLSAVYAAIAGVLYAHFLTFIAPSSFGFNFSVELVTMVVLGGMASVWGSVFGAFYLTVLPEVLRVFENIEILLYGAILILCMMFMPDGLAGGVGKITSILKKAVKKVAGA